MRKFGKDKGGHKATLLCPEEWILNSESRVNVYDCIVVWLLRSVLQLPLACSKAITDWAVIRVVHQAQLSNLNPFLLARGRLDKHGHCHRLLQLRLPPRSCQPRVLPVNVFIPTRHSDIQPLFIVPSPDFSIWVPLFHSRPPVDMSNLNRDSRGPDRL